MALACAVAPSWGWLLILRLAQGIALAGLPAAATAYLREELHPDTYARAAGLYIGGNALGGMTGRLLTGAVADVAGLALGAGVGRPARAALRRHRGGHAARVTQLHPGARPAAPSGAHAQGRAYPTPGCWRSTGSAPAAWARSWASTT